MGAEGKSDISGCIDDSACNYNSEATVDDGSCEYPETNHDCDGNCSAAEYLGSAEGTITLTIQPDNNYYGFGSITITATELDEGALHETVVFLSKKIDELVEEVNKLKNQ